AGEEGAEQGAAAAAPGELDAHAQAAARLRAGDGGAGQGRRRGLCEGGHTTSIAGRPRPGYASPPGRTPGSEPPGPRWRNRSSTADLIGMATRVAGTLADGAASSADGPGAAS